MISLPILIIVRVILFLSIISAYLMQGWYVVACDLFGKENPLLGTIIMDGPSENMRRAIWMWPAIMLGLKKTIDLLK